MECASVIFDLDGTLADTSVDLINAANACFDHMGLGPILEPGRDAGDALRGGRRMLTVGLERAGCFDPELVSQYYPMLLRVYGEDLCRHTHLYPGAMQAVEQITADGFAVGICTNKPEGLARRLLHELGVLQAFGSVIGADTLPVRKPDPEPLLEASRRAGGGARTILIGDSVTDRDTARAAGVPCVLVTFGPAGGDMAALQPQALLRDFADLPQIARTLLGQ